MKRLGPALLLTACSGSPLPTVQSSSSEGTPENAATTSQPVSLSSTTDSASSTTSVESTTSGSSTAGEQTHGQGFITDPDGGVPGFECSLFEQDCPRGEKCNSWANDGGSAWNATQCVPLDPNPDGIGEPCSVQVAPLSGVDSCEHGSMCWFIDLDIDGNAVGRCVPHCSGTPNAPTCEDPNRECVITRALSLCIPRCDPLVPDECGAGRGCYLVEDGAECAPDASGDAGAAFETCTFPNACDPGLACTDAAVVGLCETGVQNCCAPLCSLQEPTCPEGTQCNPAFAEGMLPPGYEDVGVCGQEAP